MPAVAKFYRKEMNVTRNMAAPSDFRSVDSLQLVIQLALHSTLIEFAMFTIEYVIQSYYSYYYMLHSFENLRGAIAK